VSSKNNYSKFVFYTLRTKHQTLTNAENFHVVHVGVQRYIFYWFYS